jgi:P pilus assembly chaperone PapD
MIGLTCRRFIVVVALALVPASAGASAGRPPVALTATPARVLLAGSAHTSVRVTNSGTKPVAVDVSRAGFALDLRGRPRIVKTPSARSAAGWLTLEPAHFTIAPRSSASLVVTAKLPRGAEPGDHDALALLWTRPLASGRVAVRLRLGVVVVVRAPGAIVRRLELRRLRVARRGRATVLEVTVANPGNVTESLQEARAILSRLKSGREIAAARTANRDLRPRTRGIVTFRYRRTLHGPMTARVVIPADGGRGRLQRTYWIRL